MWTVSPKYIVPYIIAGFLQSVAEFSIRCITNCFANTNKGSQIGQATGLDAWASRVKCPARFVAHLYEICIYIWVVYSFCLFCCLLIIVTWWYVWCIVWASGRVGVNSIPELELQLNCNSNSGIGIGIEICGIENGIRIENSGIGIENRIFFQLLPQHIYKSLDTLLIEFDNKPTLFQVMAWCHHARSHYLNLCWPRSQTLYCVIRPQ